MSDRIVDLEIQLTHQQLQLEELNQLVYDQRQQLDRMLSELRQVKEQLQVALPSLNKEPDEESPPPHY